MFETLQQAPPDPILGLTEAFKQDPNPNKINLSVGVYEDAQGRTPILSCVKEAEKRLLENEQNKAYLGIDGLPGYGALVRELMFGKTLPEGRGVTVQTPGGTGALRVAADFIKDKFPQARIWCSQPTWNNHPNVFQAAGLEVETYPYMDQAGNDLDYENMTSAIAQIPAGDVICLHACCHNPTGIDPSIENWKQIGQLLQQRGILPLIDFAYQGFGEGIREDAGGLAELVRSNEELLICSSFSKNFGLYGERVGALTVVAGSEEAAQAALSHVKARVRANYSNPPKHGAAIVATVLDDDGLHAQWESEVAQMRQRINGMRQLFVKTMQELGVQRDFSFITRQRGMFSFSGLNAPQVDQLRREHAIYIVRSGRINVAGMTEQNMERLCQAIASVL